MQLFRLFAFAIVFLISGCATKINPAQPPDQPIVVPPPAPPSTAQISASIDLAIISKAIEAQLPTRPGGIFFKSGMDIGSKTTLEIGIHRAGPVTVVPENNCIRIHFPLGTDRGRIDKDFGFPIGSHHALLPDRVLDLSTKACLGVADDWHLTSQLDTDFKWESNPVLIYDIFNSHFGKITIDIADKINPALHEKIRDMQKSIELELATVPVRTKLQEIWTASFQPIEAWSSPPLYVAMTPISAGVSSIMVAGTKAQIHPTLVTHLVLTPNSQAATTPTHLPTNLGNLPQDGIHALVRAEASFVEINHDLRRLIGMTFTEPNVESLMVDNVTLFGYGSRVGLRLDFHAKGTVNAVGWLYLVGQPHFDYSRQRLYVDHLDFDPNTSSLLVNSAATLGHAYIRQQIEHELVFDTSRIVTPIVNEAYAGAHNLNIGSSAMAVLTVSKISASDIVATKEGILLDMIAEGSAQIEIPKIGMPGIALDTGGK